jgi:DHA2 family multidrug resistance protein
MSIPMDQESPLNSQADSGLAGLRRFLAAARPNPYIGTVGVFLGAGLSTLNGRLVSVGLPDLRGALGLGVDEAAWIPTAYNMALMFMGPLSVYLGALLGPRRVLLAAGTIFTLCSILLPLSPNLGVMLLLQAISGLASGTFYPLTLTYALRALPMRYTIYGVGVYSMDILGVTSLAVPLEGWFMEHLSWRWIFWCSALLTPVMMFCIAAAIPHPPKRPGARPNVSWHGFLYFSIALSLIYGALDQGERLDWLNSGVIVGLLAAAAFLLVAVLVRRLLSPNPMVNPSFITKRNTLILAVCLFSFRFVLLAAVFLIPAYLGAIQGYRPTETGRVLLWMILPQLIAGLLAARLMRRFDSRLILAGGFCIVAVACLLNAQLTSAWASENFRLTQWVIAAGFSFTFVGLVGSLIQQAIETDALAKPINVLTYSASLHLVRLLGGELGSTVMQRLVSVREQFHSNALGLHIASGNWVTDERLRALTAGLAPNSAGTEEAQGRAALVLGGQIKAQAYTLAYQDGFRTIALVAAIALILIALLKPMQIRFDSESADPPG